MTETELEIFSDFKERLNNGTVNRIEGDHPRTLYTTSIGSFMSCGEESIDI
eukprot:Pgem_evm1s18867